MKGGEKVNQVSTTTEVEQVQNEETPFLMTMFEVVTIDKRKLGEINATQYTTSSGGRETEYDDDP